LRSGRLPATPHDDRISKSDLHMKRASFVVLGIALITACSPEPPAPSGAAAAAPSGDDAFVRTQAPAKPEISVDKILADVIDKGVSVPDAAGEAQPMDWVFEASEPKNAQILETKPSDKGVALVVQMNTSGAPGSDDANVQLSGKLVLHYEWSGRDWVLRRIQNMTFRYTRRLMI
jgi:hypothetical protein